MSGIITDMLKLSFTTNRIYAWLDHHQPPASAVLGIAALLVGLAGGVGVWLFKQLIDWVHLLVVTNFGGMLARWGGWTAALLPMLGGVVVGLIIHYMVGAERHHGVAGIMEAAALAGGRLRYKRVPAKAVAAAISIGSGASVGPEDPSVQIGANLGSMFGQWLHLSDDRIRALVAAGAAAGISAAFNAPIAGIFFALEIVLGEIGGSAFGVVVLASVVSAVFTQAVSGVQPAFRIPAYAFNSAWELPLYLGLGLLAGPVASLYVRTLYIIQDRFHDWHIPRWSKPVVAGLAVGIVGLFLPQILGVGYETIEQILNGEHLAIGLLLGLLVAKMVLTAVCIGGGFPGGVFAPSLFLGAMLGAAFGQGMEQLFPSLTLDPPAFAMVGMAAVLAGAVHTPLTASLLLFEMTNDYRIILPLMFAVVVSMLISQQLQKDSVYTLGLARKGIRIQRGRDIEVLQAITVGEVMDTEMPTLTTAETLEAATEKLIQWRHHGLPVLDEAGELVGILTVQDIERAQAAGKESERPYLVGDCCTRRLLVAYPDETLADALHRLSVRDIGRLPVVARDNPHHLLGVLRRSAMIRAYDLALTRRASLRHKAHQVRLGAVQGINVDEIVIEVGAVCEGVHVSEVAWPHDCVIATLRRGRQLIIPRGDTVLRAGDVLTVVAENETQAVVRALCHVPHRQV
ncbi:MAG: chloride channel protein [Ardenticatenaceae bacterium]|nr:chloride channel protein [Ardenticatenaceae bacterium]